MTISTATAVGTSTAAQSSNIGIQDFLKILTAQLNNQDPLKPVDNQEFVAQIAQFATLEQSRQLNVKIDELLSTQSTNNSVGLLGRTVDINRGTATVTGKVSAVSFRDGEPVLTVTGTTGVDLVKLSEIVNIR